MMQNAMLQEPYEDICGQIDRYFKAVYGPKYVYRAPETFPNMLERWMLGVLHNNKDYMNACMTKIENHCKELELSYAHLTLSQAERIRLEVEHGTGE